MKKPKAIFEAVMDRYQGGYQWRKLPSEYGLKWNFVARAHRRWSERQACLMSLLTLQKEIDYGVLLIDSTFVKAHRSAAGARRNGLTPERSRRKQGIGKTKRGLNSKGITLVGCRGDWRPMRSFPAICLNLGGYLCCWSRCLSARVVMSWQMGFTEPSRSLKRTSGMRRVLLIRENRRS